MLSFEEDYTQSALLVDADRGAARKSDEILLLKMDAISAMHEDTRQSSVDSANSCTSEDDGACNKHNCVFHGGYPYFCFSQTNFAAMCNI